MLSSNFKKFKEAFGGRDFSEKGLKVLHDWYIENGVEVDLETASKSEQFKEYKSFEDYQKKESYTKSIIDLNLETIVLTTSEGHLLVENY